MKLINILLLIVGISLLLASFPMMSTEIFRPFALASLFLGIATATKPILNFFE